MQSLWAETATPLPASPGGIAEAFYGMPEELKRETLSRLPGDLLDIYELFLDEAWEKVAALQG